MVAGNTDMSVLSQKPKALMRVWPVADHVPQAPNLFHTPHPLDIIQHGDEGGQIGVNIGYYSITHL